MFPYTVTDTKTGLFATAFVHIVFAPNAVKPPVAVDDLYLCPNTAITCRPTPSILVNDSSPNGATLTIVGFEQPPAGQGTVALDVLGNLVYTLPRM